MVDQSKNTVSIDRIAISEDLKNRILLQYKLEDGLITEFEKLVAKATWVPVSDGDYYYIHEDKLLLVNACKKGISSKDFWTTNSFPWEKMDEKTAIKWFVARKEGNPMIADDYVKYVDISGAQFQASEIYCADTRTSIGLKSSFANLNKNCADTRVFMGLMSSSADLYKYSHAITNTDSVKIPIYHISENSTKEILKLLLTNNMNPFSSKTNASKIFSVLYALSQKDLKLDEAHIVLIDNQEMCEEICTRLEQVGITFDFNSPELVKKLDEIGSIPDERILNDIQESLVNCDARRVNMEPYPVNILHDPESGHWDLWDDGEEHVTIPLATKLVARNPVFDAMSNKSGVVGIDFGTKSTVVMYRQSRADVLPMRIGSGHYARAVSKSDYENPTVMEIHDVKKFMEAYNKKKGRPETFWEDLLISHEAAEQLKSEQSKGDTFASFFSELKQWAGDKSRQVRLRDLQGNEINIPAYLSLGEEDFDPIEIYAYYLGLFINNMVHKIYLRYRLSFPATVEKQVRDKILGSFTKGLKKSLPTQVLNDEACMKIFKVEQGASEPAAYAITALYGYGFEPEEEEKYYYGIFDFGGGTTDFDFGVWSSEEEEPENYDYQISHFGQGGDPYLGGENLLEILAYHVFLKNYDKLLEDKVVFIRPSGEKEIVGKDYLVCQDSQYAHFNQKRLMEKLRGIWERNEEIRQEIASSGIITVQLFTMDGKTKYNYSLEVNLEELDALLENRIDKGVAQFFDAMKNCFGVNGNQKDLHNVDGIHIFLAGNSSKSPIVYKAFKKYIDLFSQGLNEKAEEPNDWFKVYPPLGTPISDEILAGNVKPSIDAIIEHINTVSKGTADSQKEDLTRPTGKTGVAYGLLNNRVRVVQNETEEIGFRFFIGQNRKSKFYCVIDKDNQNYNQWVRFCTASREEFDIWFTRSAAAPSNKLPIDQIGVYSEPGFVEDPSAEKAVYIRTVSPTEIEYVVADEEEMKKGTFDAKDVCRVVLQEKQ